MYDNLIKLETAAARCKRLAATIGDLTTAERLLELAVEYEAQATLLRQASENEQNPIKRV